jgi:hypothetical protein
MFCYGLLLCDIEDLLSMKRWKTVSLAISKVLLRVSTIKYIKTAVNYALQRFRTYPLTIIKYFAEHRGFGKHWDFQF